MIEYEGENGIRKALNMALSAKTELRSALNAKPLVYLVGEEFATQYMNTRKERNITLKSLRFSNDEVDLPKHMNYSEYNKEVRHLLSKEIPNHSVLIWDDTVAIIDTQKLQTKIFTDVLIATSFRDWFDMLWELAITSNA